MVGDCYWPSRDSFKFLYQAIRATGSKLMPTRKSYAILFIGVNYYSVKMQIVNYAYNSGHAPLDER